MTVEASENNNVFRLSYCIICDASSTGGENSFLRSLGELQREQKVELSLESCDCEDALPNMLWKIKFVSE
tara:strand:+ start:147 stop:356 length:210 start_codon:yes stop_codon:yes gene_type:complete